MNEQGSRTVIDLGDDEPLFVKAPSPRPVARRTVSTRWLGAAVLTAVLSGVLFVGALEAAIGSVDRSAVALGQGGRGTHAPRLVSGKGDRIKLDDAGPAIDRVIPISTVTRVNDRDVIRTKPFRHLRARLATPVDAEIVKSVPRFDALRIYSVEGKEAEPAPATAWLYRSRVEGEIAIKVSPLPNDELLLSAPAEMTDADAVAQVRDLTFFDEAGLEKLAALSAYAPPDTLRSIGRGFSTDSAVAVSATPENVSFLAKSLPGEVIEEPDEIFLSVDNGDTLIDLVTQHGADDAEAIAISNALAPNVAAGLQAGQKVRLALAPDETGRQRPVRVSLYSGETHQATVALSDLGNFITAEQPPYDPGLFREQPLVSENAMPRIYDGLYRSVLALDAPSSVAEALVRIFSFDVDLQGQATPADSIELIYALDEEQGKDTVLFAKLRLADTERRFYRFRSPDDGLVDYYDETGKSAKKFLMRKPVSGGRFRSPFGMRRHPILKRYKMHGGVDWAAARGTPIMAAGDGIVEKAGWYGGYGKFIRIRHANGYKTSYSHQSRFAKNIEKGARVRQGEVIGYIGSTGLSTGPHLHYEVLVNGSRVDPMRIRLPRGRTLQGEILAKFEKERNRIDTLHGRKGAQVAAR